MGDGSIYHGEVAYELANHPTVYASVEETPEEHRSKVKPVRHGYGIQLYGHNDKDQLIYYAGQWVKDHKNGQGVCFYPDGNYYQGTYKNDKFHEQGKLDFTTKDEYRGGWVDGKMEGEGFFSSTQVGTNFGAFKNNLMLYGEA
jgi:hypothetical protein